MLLNAVSSLCATLRSSQGLRRTPSGQKKTTKTGEKAPRRCDIFSLESAKSSMLGKTTRHWFASLRLKVAKRMLAAPFRQKPLVSGLIASANRDSSAAVVHRDHLPRCHAHYAHALRTASTGPLRFLQARIARLYGSNAAGASAGNAEMRLSKGRPFSLAKRVCWLSLHTFSG